MQAKFETKLMGAWNEVGKIWKSVIMTCEIFREK